MFARALAYFHFVFTLAILAAAMPGGSPPATTTQTITVTQTATSPEPTWACTTGPIQCCESIQKPTDHEATVILGLLELVVEGLNVLVGLTCSALTGVANGSCEANVVCCQNNNVGGLISIGCIPIIL
ncbi:fungal hydrophobin [Ganoderma leucocontextum]|nr:fungal hydrophobin [Ganoderma leucocontextum]